MRGIPLKKFTGLFPKISARDSWKKWQLHRKLKLLPSLNKRQRSFRTTLLKVSIIIKYSSITREFYGFLGGGFLYGRFSCERSQMKECGRLFKIIIIIFFNLRIQMRPFTAADSLNLSDNDHSLENLTLKLFWSFNFLACKNWKLQQELIKVNAVDESPVR